MKKTKSTNNLRQRDTFKDFMTWRHGEVPGVTKGRFKLKCWEAGY